MPRIRKKTSNRANTRDRAKVKKKVSDHHKKAKKAGKKNVEWKSKKKADPGIPNNYPYKDQVLAELAEEKRQAEEAKLARREAQRNPNQLDPEAETPGIQSLFNSTVLSSSAALPIAKASSSKAAAEATDVPELIDTELTNLQDVLDKADVVVEVVDARDIAGGRCGWVEGLIKDAGGKVMVVVTKIDLVPREALEQWLPHLPESTFLFSSSSTVPAAGSSTAAPVLGRAELLAALRSLSTSTTGPSTSSAPSEPVVAIMGLPNSGKTSLLNCLLSPTAPRYPVASSGAGNAAKHPEPTTKAPVEVRIDLGEGRAVKVIDTPGWEFAEANESDEEDEEEADEAELDKWDQLEERVAGDLLRRNLGRVDRVKDILPLAQYIVSRSNAQDLMLAYNIPFFKEGDVEAFLTAVARVNGRVKKHGVLDLDAAARILVRDWALGNFPYYSAAPKSTSAAAANGETSGKADMSAVLAACRGRKEMRASGGKGLIRFRGGEVDQRQIVLDDDYTALAGALSDDDEDGEEEEEEELEEVEDEEEDDDDEAEGEDGLALASDEGEELLDLEDGPEPSSGSDVPHDDEEDDEEEEEEEEIEEPAPKTNKRKLPSSPSSADKRKKAKRVSFGRDVVGGLSSPATPKSQGKAGKAGKANGKGTPVPAGKGKGGADQRDFKGLGKRRR